MLVTKTAQELQMPEDIVEKVVSFQFAEANRASRQHSDIEISGFGTFHVSPSKVRKKLDKLSKAHTALVAKLPTLPPGKLASVARKMQGLEQDIQFLKTKLDGN